MRHGDALTLLLALVVPSTALLLIILAADRLDSWLGLGLHAP